MPSGQYYHSTGEPIVPIKKLRNRQLRNMTLLSAAKSINHQIRIIFLIIGWTLISTGMLRAADPGSAYLPDNLISDQKPGSILFFNVYTSDATDSREQNAKFSVTNTSPTKGVAIHIFFVDGMSGSPADFIFCLTPSQTISFEAVELDPNTEGYIVVIATDSNGAPIVHNSLIGDVFVKFSSGHRAGLGALAVAARQVPTVPATDAAVNLDFDGVSYDRLPLTLAVDNVPSRINNNDTVVFINRPVGDLTNGVGEIGHLFGLLFNDTENAYSFGHYSSRCQTRLTFNGNTPRTAPRFTTVVPDGRSGWVRLYSVSNTPIIGAFLNYNSGSSSVPNAFSGGRNLHILTTTTAQMTIPVYPTRCSIG